MCYRVAALTQSGQAGGLSLGGDRSDPHHCPRGFNAARPALTFHFTPSTNSNLPGATSLDMVETIMSLEDEFDIVISDRDAETFKAVGDAIALVKNKV